MLLLPMALLTFTSCSSTSSSPASGPLTKVNATNVPSAYDVVSGGGNMFVLNSITVTNTVVSVDAAPCASPRRPRSSSKNHDPLLNAANKNNT
jgi:hypothetical protein